MGSENKDTKLSRTIASTETLKIAEIHTLDIFYTPLEERFERITRLARCALRLPVSAVTVLNNEKQWFKSIVGWAVSELPLEKSFCTWTVQGADLLLVPDTQADTRFSNHPLVLKRPKFRFYAGYPLLDKNGGSAGTFCVMDIKPRKASTHEIQAIRDLAAMAQRELFADQLTDAQAMLTAKLSAARREAMMDPLTRLWNRRGAAVLLRAAIKQADEQGTDLALGLLDVDRFKRINDLHGHPTGDEALRKVARSLVASVRSEDIVCRHAGDEFLIIMTGTDSQRAAQIVERVRHTICDTPIRTREGTLPMTVSVGYAVRAPGDSVTEEELFARADEALMRSKGAGRNQVRRAGSA